MSNSGSSWHAIWLGTLLIVSTCVIDIVRAEELQFQGQKVFGPKTGFTVLPDKDRHHLTISSMLHHFWLILPYSESWQFETSRDTPLEAQDDQHVVTIKIVGKRASSDLDHLEGIASNLQATGSLELRHLTYLEAHGRAVLRYQTRAVSEKSEAGAGGVYWNYWTIAHRKRERYVLHISASADPSSEDNPDDQRLLDMMTAGFDADFEVK